MAFVLRALPMAARAVHTKGQKPSVLRAGGPDQSAAESHGDSGNVHTPFPQALISCDRLCQTMKELIADPYGK